MATFVSLVTCHHCPVVSSRRGLVYRDSLTACRSLRRSSHTHCRLTRPELPESSALARSKPPGSMKHLVLSHLRRLLTLSGSQQGGHLHLPV